MKLNKIHHIAILCSDYQKSKSFYVNILGLTALKETYRKERESFKLDLGLNGSYAIELFSFPNPPKRASRPEAVGLRHLAFEVDDLLKTVMELEGKDVVVEAIRTDENTQKKYTFFNDPDGLPIEIYER